MLKPWKQQTDIGDCDQLLEGWYLSSLVEGVDGNLIVL
jgi:hypothetical protein